MIDGTSSHRFVEALALAERVVAPRPRAVVELLAVVEHAAAQRLPVAVRRGGDGHVEHRGERREAAVALHQRDGAHLRLGHLLVAGGRRWRDVDEHQLGHQVGLGGGDAQRGQPAQRHADHQPWRRRPLAQHRQQRLGAEPGSVVTVLAPGGAAVPGQVDRQRGHAQPEDDGVPGVGVLSAAVQEDHLRRGVTPLERADRRRTSTRSTAGSGPVAPICSAFSGSSANSSRPSSSSSEISAIARPYKPAIFGCARGAAVPPSTHGRHDDDRSDDSHCRGRRLARDGVVGGRRRFGSFRPQEATDMWRTLIPAGGARRRLRRGRRRRHGVLPRSSADRAGRRRAADGGGVLGVRVADASSARRPARDVRRVAPPHGRRALSDRRSRGVRGRHLHPLRLRAGERRRDADRRPPRGAASTPRCPIPAASGSSAPAEHRDRHRGDLRALAAAHARRPAHPAPAVGRGVRRPRGVARTAAARSSRCCTTTASRSTGCTATANASRSGSPSWPRSPATRTSRCGGRCSAWT